VYHFEPGVEMQHEWGLAHRQPAWVILEPIDGGGDDGPTKRKTSNPNAPGFWDAPRL